MTVNCNIVKPENKRSGVVSEENVENNITNTDSTLQEIEYEWEWVNGLVDQVLFADKILEHYHVQLVVKKYCDCWPNCYNYNYNDEGTA